jgi:hypothetical protein
MGSVNGYTVKEKEKARRSGSKSLIGIERFGSDPRTE